MDELTRTGPQSVAGPGFTIGRMDRFTMRYQNASGRTLKIPVELITAPFLRSGEPAYTLVRLKRIKGWEPPHEQEPFAVEDYRALREQLSAALDELMPNTYRFEE